MQATHVIPMVHLCGVVEVYHPQISVHVCLKRELGILSSLPFGPRSLNFKPQDVVDTAPYT